MGGALPARYQDGKRGNSHPKHSGSVSVHLQLDRRGSAKVTNTAAVGRRPPDLLKVLLSSGRKLFSDKDGNLLKTGDTVKFEKLADTLEIIANEGAGAFYHGRIAEDLIRDVREAGRSAWILALGNGPSSWGDPPELKLFLFRRNADGRRLGGVQSCSDGRVERPLGGVQHVLPPAACRGSRGRLHHQRHERLPSGFIQASYRGDG